MSRWAGRGRAAAVALLVVVAGCAGIAGMGDEGTPSPAESTVDTTTLSPTETASERGPSPSASFREVAAEWGLNYTTETPPTMIVNGGVYVLDYNGDRWPDLLAVGGPEPVLFENTHGGFERSGALPAINATVEGAHAFDFDADGREDLLLLAQNHTPILLENQGHTFLRRPGAFPVTMTYPVGAASADYNGDGCLDVFVFQYADWANKRPAGVRDMTVSGVADNGNPNYLFRGTCTAEFAPANGSAIRGSRWTLAASFVDLTGDGRPDIHVANDFNHDLLYVNRGGGAFERIILGNATNRNAMSSEVADVDRDGRFDIFTTNIYLPQLIKQTAGPFAGRMHGNNLLLNRGNGSFRDAADQYDARRGGWGWAAVIADFDNDGDQDLFHTTKRIQITPTIQSDIVREGLTVESYVARHPSIRYPQYFERFEDGFVEQWSSGLGFEATSGTGVARADFDRDGALDLAVAQVEGPVRLYLNTLNASETTWIRIELRRSEDVPATGARVTVTAGNRTYRRVANSRADHLSQDSRIVHVGLAGADRVDRIRIVWPDGSQTIVEDVAPNQRLVLTPGDG